MDYIIHGLVEKSARIFIATTKNLVEEAREIHITSKVCTAALGRLLTAGSLMGAMLKNEKDVLTLSIKGDGETKSLVVTADGKSNVKGYIANPNVDIPLKANGKLDVGGALGFGELRVIKDIGLKESVSGAVELISGEIAEDLTYYFAKSEQIPSSVALGVLVDRDYSVKCAGGFIIQILPDAKEEIISKLENTLPKLPPITSLLNEGYNPEQILKEIFPVEEITIYDKIFPKFSCDCSREKMTKALIAVGVNELKSMKNEDKGASLKCHFCKKENKYTEEDLQKIIESVS